MAVCFMKIRVSMESASFLIFVKRFLYLFENQSDIGGGDIFPVLVLSPNGPG